MSKCPICETENAPGLTVCDFCGSELPETKKCQACGEEIPKNASYCPICKNLADVKPASSSSGGRGVPMYYVGLDFVGDDRQEVLKVVQEICKCSFDEAREIVDGDGIILNEVPKLEAEMAVSRLRGVGARATMEEIDEVMDDILAEEARGGSSKRSYSRSSSSNDGGFVNSSTYGILAIVFSALGGWLGLVLCLYGLFKSSNDDVRKKCKIGLIVLGVVVVLAIVLGVIAGAAAGSMAGSYY